MHCRSSIHAVAQAVALLTTIGCTQAFDDTKYPNLKGQWTRAPVAGAAGPPSFDPGKPPGRGQQAPLTPEYQAIFETNLREREAGVPGTWPGPSCLPPGMPATMTAYQPMEIIVLPHTTFIRIDYIRETRRRIFTDGRIWPHHVEPGFDGYSIGRWIDEGGDGKFDVLEVETRHFKGPRHTHATSRARAHSTSAAFPCTRTIKPSSRSGSSSIRPTRISCTTKSPSSTML